MHEQMPRNTGAIIRRRRDKPVHENLMVVDGPDVHGQNSNLKYIPLLLLSLPSTWLLPDATLKWLWTPAQILAMRAPQVKLDYIILVAAFHGNLVPYSSTSCISRTHSAYSQCKSRVLRQESLELEHIRIRINARVIQSPPSYYLCTTASKFLQVCARSGPSPHGRYWQRRSSVQAETSDTDVASPSKKGKKRKQNISVTVQ